MPTGSGAHSKIIDCDADNLLTLGCEIAVKRR